MQLLNFSVLFLFLFIVPAKSFAWYCYEVASEKNGDTINACGIAESSDEDLARKLSLENAYRELELICNNSIDCAGKALEISPLRTECKKVNDIYRCHRGITAEITKKERDPDQKSFFQEVYLPKKIIQVDSDSYRKQSTIMHFKSNPSNANVYVDGVEICATPCSREISLGEHKISFEIRDYDIFSSVKVVKGEDTLEANLNPKFGYINFLDFPKNAVIKIDDNQISLQEELRVLPGEHLIAVISKYHQPWHKEVTVKKGEVTELIYEAEKLWGYLKIVTENYQSDAVAVQVEVDGVLLDDRTPATHKIPAGEHRIRLLHDLYRTDEFQVELSVNESKELRRRLETKIKKDWAFLFGFGGSANTVESFKADKEYSCCMLIELGLQRMFYKKLGFKLNYNFLSDLTNESNFSTQLLDDTPNTTNYVVKGAEGHILGMGLLFLDRDEQKGSWFIYPEIGIIKGRLKYDKIEYSAFGNGYRTSDVTEFSYGQKYYAINVGWDFLKLDQSSHNTGFYIQGGVRKTSELMEASFSRDQNVSNVPKNKSLVGYVTFGVIFAY